MYANLSSKKMVDFIINCDVLVSMLCEWYDDHIIFAVYCREEIVTSLRRYEYELLSLPQEQRNH